MISLGERRIVTAAYTSDSVATVQSNWRVLPVFRNPESLLKDERSIRILKINYSQGGTFHRASTMIESIQSISCTEILTQNMQSARDAGSRIQFIPKESATCDSEWSVSTGCIKHCLDSPKNSVETTHFHRNRRLFEIRCSIVMTVYIKKSRRNWMTARENWMTVQYKPMKK
jgi:hypothetical protein